MSAKELFSVYKKIKERITTGVESFEMINKFIVARADADEKISKILRDLIPAKILPNDPIMESICEQVRIEANQFQRSAEDLRKLVINSSTGKPFAKTQDDNKKSILKVISKQTKDLKKYIEDMDSSCENYHKEKKALEVARSEKRDQQQKRFAKATEDLKRKTQICDNFATKSKTEELPQIAASFTDFDSKRLKNLQENVQLYSQIAARTHGLAKESCDRLNKKMATFDAADRSTRFVSSTLDPKGKPTDENQELYAYAIADYRSDEPQDLNFVAGDKIKVTLQHNSGWWEGEFDSKIGYFPRTFVQIPQRSLNKVYVCSVMVCKADFPPPNQELQTNMQEIAMSTGDLMFVNFIQNGRCNGRNLRTKQAGNFPESYLVSINDNPFIQQNEQSNPPSPHKPGTPAPQQQHPQQQQKQPQRPIQPRSNTPQPISNASANQAAFAQLQKQPVKK